MTKKKISTLYKEAPNKYQSILQREIKVPELISTGSTQLDLAISCGKDKYGGLPACRIIELSGSGASGKTYFCGELSGNAIRMGYDVYVDDIERRWDLSRLKTFGFDTTNKQFIYLDPINSVEECFERMLDVASSQKKGKKALYIVDPIAALIAEQERKSDKMGQARAKAVQKHMRFLKDKVSSFSDPQLTVIFSNQLIDAVGRTFGPSKTSPMGNAMRHWPSVRIRFAVRKVLREEKKGRTSAIKLKVPRGVQLIANVIKNSEDDAFRTADLTILYSKGIDDVYDNASWLKKYTKALGKNASWYKLPKATKDKKAHPNLNGIKEFIAYIEEKNLERRLRFLVSKHYRRLHEPDDRKLRKW